MDSASNLFRAVSWIETYEIMDKEISSQYLDSIYWGFTTMSSIGYGDIHPISTEERIYATFSIIVSSGIFAYTINGISKQVRGYNRK